MSTSNELEVYIGTVEDQLSSRGRVLVEVARRLARQVDYADPEEVNVAAYAKELRATLDQLAGEVKDDDDSWTRTLGQPVPPEIRDPAQPEQADARPKGRRGRKTAG